MSTVATNTLRLHVRAFDRRQHGIAAFTTKGLAVDYLDRLRAGGLNCETDIEAHRAVTLSNVWVIGRPDHFHGITYLMTKTGAWVPGRLEDAPCFCDPACTGTAQHLTPWRTFERPPVRPATVTHNYQYSGGTVGVSDGNGNPVMVRGFFGPPREATAWLSEAWCVACPWKTHDGDEHSVREFARWHRANPAAFADHATPRRTVARLLAAPR